MKAVSYFGLAFKQHRYQSSLGISMCLNSGIHTNMSNFATNTNVRENNSVGTSEERVINKKYQCCSKTTRYECDFTWTIQNFKLFGESYRKIKSPAFSAAENTCKFLLELTPLSESYPWTRLFLKTFDSKADFDNFGPISGELQCSIINSDGSKKNIYKNNIMLNKSDSYFCIDNFPEGQSMFTDKNLLPQGELTINCMLSYIREKDIVHVFDQHNTSEPNAYLSYLTEDFGKLLNNEKLSDVTIYVGEVKYPAHKVILAARSSLFQCKFTASQKYQNLRGYSETIIIDNDITAKVFFEMLRYIYMDKVENIETMAFELLFAAVKYEIAGLKMMCENELCRTLAVDTVIKILLFSNIHNLEKLKNHAIKYIKSNLAEISDSEAWNDLVSQPNLLKAVLKT